MFRDALVVMSPDNASNSNPMLEQIQAMIENPPKEINGVPDSFLDELERVPKKDLKKDDECAICRVPFLDGRSVRAIQEADTDPPVQTRILSSWNCRATQTTGLTWTASGRG